MAHYVDGSAMLNASRRGADEAKRQLNEMDRDGAKLPAEDIEISDLALLALENSSSAKGNSTVDENYAYLLGYALAMRSYLS